MHPDAEWDPDYYSGVPVLTCEFCARGVMRTHGHYLYRNRWRALTDVHLPPVDQEVGDDQDPEHG